MRGSPSGFSRYWYTPPLPSSTTKSRSVIRTGSVSLSTGGSPSGVGSGVGTGVGVATTTGVGVGVATVTGVLGLPPPPQETAAAPRIAAIHCLYDFIALLPCSTSSTDPDQV